MTCWEEELKAIVPEKDLRAFQTDPEKVEQYVESRVKTVESQCYKGLLNTPHACLKSGYGTVGAKQRSFGVREFRQDCLRLTDEYRLIEAKRKKKYSAG